MATAIPAAAEAAGAAGAAETAGAARTAGLAGSAGKAKKPAAAKKAGTAEAKGEAAEAAAEAAGAKKEKAEPKKKEKGGVPDLPSGAGRPSRKRRVRAWAWAGNRRVLTAEFLLCMTVLTLGSVVSPDGVQKGSARFLVKGTALSAVFFLLALVSSGGQGPRKAATAVGTLVTAAYVFTSADVTHLVQWVSSFFNPKGNVFSKAEQSALEKAGGNVVRKSPSQTAEENVGGNLPARPSVSSSAAQSGPSASPGIIEV